MNKKNSNKQKILNKAKNDMKKEELKELRIKGQSLAYVVFLILGGSLMIFDFFMGKDPNEVLTLVWGVTAATSFNKYKMYKQKLDLVLFVVATLACISSLTLYIMSTIK